jgi:topoisomerase-4 subunit A
MNKDYFLVPDGATVLHIDTKPKFTFTLKYTPKPRLKVLAEDFKAHDYNVRGLKAGGIRLSNKEVSKIDTGKKKNDEQ